MECELYWQNGEVYAGATFKDQDVNKLAIFLGHTIVISVQDPGCPIKTAKLFIHTIQLVNLNN